MSYLAGWNILGEDPDNGPKMFETWNEARTFLSAELSWLVLEYEDLADSAIIAANQLSLVDIRSLGIPKDFTCRIGDFIYWIRRDAEVLDVDISQL